MRSWYQSKVHEDIKVLVSHEEESFDLIREVIRAHNPQMIIELGTAYYGLTLILHEAAPSVPLYTFDKYCGRLHLSRTKRKINKEQLEHIFRKAFNRNVHFIIGDVIAQKSELLLALINMPVRKLLYCDNGKKEREIVYYGSALGSGDVLGVHDWRLEVNPERPIIKETLAHFTPLFINGLFRAKGLTTRFFVR